MKKIYTILFALILLAASMNIVIADDEELELPEPGRVSAFSENFRLAFTFSKEKKIERLLEYAERRLAYAETISEEAPERAAEIQESYEELLEKAESISEGFEPKANSENGLDTELAKRSRVRNMFERHQEHTDAIYARALERFEANNASEEKIARFEEFYERASNRNEELREKAIQKQNAVMERRREILSESENDTREILKRIEEEEGIAEARERRIERAEIRIQRISEAREMKREQISARLEASNLTDEEKARLRAAIENHDRLEARIRTRVLSGDFGEIDMEYELEVEYDDDGSEEVEVELEVEIGEDGIEIDMESETDSTDSQRNSAGESTTA